MVSVRRWWDRRTLQVGLVALALGGAWVVRQTQGEFLLEVYQLISRPLQMLPTGTTPQERQEELLKNAQFLELQTRITELETQNKKLQSLLGYAEKEPLSSRPIAARVIGRSADHWWQQVTINRGSNAGIQEGYVVKAEGGLVGLVTSVTPNTSRVLLISDLKSQVGVTISRTSAKGVLRGDSSAEAVLEFYEKVPNVKVGDLVSTSMYSQKFPAGVAVGKIKSLEGSIAKVELFPPITSLDWVAVYPKAQNPELENQQSTTPKP
ncbi:MAG: rod shape-determining protein MreC [Trichormus sp.]